MRSFCILRVSNNRMLSKLKISLLVVTMSVSAAFVPKNPVQAAAANCGTIPQLEIWGKMTNARVEQYVEKKLKGDWQPYLDHLAEQLANVRKIQAEGRDAQMRYNGKLVRLSGQLLETYVAASEKRFAVVQCLADGGQDLNVADLVNFATAAGSDTATDESREVEIPAAALPMENAAVTTGPVQLDISTSCENGNAIFKVTNRGGAWPKSSIFAIYRMGNETKEVVSSRRMRLNPNQSSTFRIKASKNPTGQLGMYVDPAWYKREFAYDATVRCH